MKFTCWPEALIIYLISMRSSTYFNKKKKKWRRNLFISTHWILKHHLYIYLVKIYKRQSEIVKHLYLIIVSILFYCHDYPLSFDHNFFFIFSFFFVLSWFLLNSFNFYSVFSFTSSLCFPSKKFWFFLFIF